MLGCKMKSNQGGTEQKSPLHWLAFKMLEVAIQISGAGGQASEVLPNCGPYKLQYQHTRQDAHKTFVGATNSSLIGVEAFSAGGN